MKNKSLKEEKENNMSKKIELKNTTHKFIKTNLMTLRSRSGPFDLMRCQNCGLEGKRRQLSLIEVDGQTAEENLENCPKAVSEIPKKVMIASFNGYSPNFENIVAESVHDVIEPPRSYKDKYPNSLTTVWIAGVYEPVRLLAGEFRILE